MTSTTTRPSIAEITKNPFLGRTATTPRPYAEDPNVTYLDEAHLRQKQSQWDAAERWRAEDAALGEARRAQLDADRQAEATRRQVAARADLEAGLRREFLLNPAATENDWQVVKEQRVREALLAHNPVEAEKVKLRATGAYRL